MDMMLRLWIIKGMFASCLPHESPNENYQPKISLEVDWERLGLATLSYCYFFRPFCK